MKSTKVRKVLMVFMLMVLISPTVFSVESLHTSNGAIEIDGNLDEKMWDYADEVAYSTSNQVTAKILWDTSGIIVGFEVTDTNLTNNSTNVWEDDSIEIYIDTDNNDGSNPQTDDYQINIDIGESVRYLKGTGSDWTSWTPSVSTTFDVITSGTVNDNSDTDEGYDIELFISWSDIGGAPDEFDDMGITFGRVNDDGTSNTWTGVSGEDPQIPSTYSTNTYRFMNSRILWDNTTEVTVFLPSSGYGSWYPRLFELANGDLLCTFDTNESSTNTYVKIMKSTDDGDTWSSLSTITDASGDAANGELLQLSNGDLLCAYRVVVGSTKTLKVAKSTNNGSSWSYLSNIVSNTQGVWEPQMVQLDNGDILVFYANEGYNSTYPQVIEMKKSTNNGSTWGSGTIISSHTGSRDGMPVARILDNGDIMVVFEAHDESNPFVAKYVLSQDGGSTWGSRTLAYAPSNTNKRFAAPYFIQLPTGELVISAQTNENRSTSETFDCDMGVVISSDNGNTFNRLQYSFLTDSSESALWNSLFVLDDNTVIAATSTDEGGGTSKIVIKKGTIELSLDAMETGSITINGSLSETIWSNTCNTLIGANGNNKAEVKVTWDDTNLYIGFDVDDSKLNNDSTDVWKDDAIEVYLDTDNDGGNSPDTDDYQINIDIGSSTRYLVGNGTDWTTWSPSNISVSFSTSGTLNNNSDTDTGYVCELKIPWNQIGGKPSGTFGITFGLADDDDGGDADNWEGIPGDDPQTPDTYCDIDLME